MNKLPVFRTFGNAMAFTFGNVFTIFRLSWLPFALLLAVTAGLQFVLPKLLFGVDDPETAFKNNPLAVFEKIFAKFDLFALVQVSSMLIEGIAIAAVAVAIHRVILFGDRRPDVYFGFRFGRTELVYFVMAFLTSLIILSIIATFVVPTAYLVTGGDFKGLIDRFKDFPKNPDAVFNFAGLGALGIAYFAAWLVTIYMMLRLAVWPPSVVATGRLSPAEPWSLTRDNVWRLLGLFLLAIVILYVVVAVAAAAFWYQVAMKAHLAVPPPGPGQTFDPHQAEEAIRKAMDRETARYAPYLPLFWLGELLVYIYFTAFVVALVSYSYKALKGYDAREPIPDGGMDDAIAVAA